MEMVGDRATFAAHRQPRRLDGTPSTACAQLLRLFRKLSGPESDSLAVIWTPY